MSDTIIKKLFPNKPDAIIVGNGDFPSHHLPLQMLESGEYIVCCDGGANEYIRQGKLPQLIIGDGDSLAPHYRTQYAHLLLRIDDQETNDQTKAVNHLLNEGKKNLIIVSGTGKREDHTLGNISLLMEYLQQGANICMLTDYGIFLPCKGSRTFPAQAGLQVSIFNFSAQHMKSTGLKYNIYPFHNWWQGTLNQTDGDSFTIEADGEYLIFITYEPKESF